MASAKNIAVVGAALGAAVAVQLSIVYVSMSQNLLWLALLANARPDDAPSDDAPTDDAPPDDAPSDDAAPERHNFGEDERVRRVLR